MPTNAFAAELPSGAGSPALTGVPSVAASPEAEAFYAEVLRDFAASGLPFLVSGTYAFNLYTGLRRPTKDLDLLCKAGDFPRVFAYFQKLGYETEVEDERWIAKIRKGKLFCDVIFNSTSAVTPVNDEWIRHARSGDVFGLRVPVIAPTEFIWSKAFVQDRTRFDGSDIAHMILRQHDGIDWRRLLSYMEPYWEVLLGHVLNFRFVYPTERDRIPRWLLDELIGRLQAHAELPTPNIRVCRGGLFSQTDYQIDVIEWGFANIVGKT